MLKRHLKHRMLFDSKSGMYIEVIRFMQNTQKYTCNAYKEKENGNLKFENIVFIDSDEMTRLKAEDMANARAED